MNALTKIIRYLDSKPSKIIHRRLCIKQNCNQRAAKLFNNSLNNVACSNFNATSNPNEFHSRMFLHTMKNAVNTEEVQEMENLHENIEEVRQSENNFAKKFLEESIHYKETIMEPFRSSMNVGEEEVQQILSTDFSKMKCSDILSLLKKLSYYALNNPTKVNPDDCDNILNVLIMRCQAFTNSELIELLRYLVPLRSTLQSHNSFNKLYSTLNKVCKDKIKTFSNNEIFVICDTFRRLRDHFLEKDFIWSAISKLGSKPNRLSMHNLIQLCFLINICRKTPINMYELEYRIEQFIDDISLDELGIIAMGFFKTKTRIRNTVVTQAIMQKVMNSVDNIESVSLGSIMKLFRYSATADEAYMFRILLKSLQPRLSQYNLMTTIHIAHACSKLQIYEKDVMETILNKFQKEIRAARLKDIERMVYVMSVFNYEPNHPLYHKIIEELRTNYRQAEIIKFKNVLPYLLQYLAYVKLYPIDLIQMVLDDNYMQKIISRHGYSALSREFIIMDYGLKIEVPEYNGPFLNEKIKKYLLKKHSSTDESYRRSSKIEKLLTDIIHVSKDILGGQSVPYITQILPHIQSKQIVIAIDKDNKIVPAEPLLSSFPLDAIKYVNGGDLKETKFLALVIVGNSCLFKGSQQLVGGINTIQLRHLEALGYIPILIYQVKWEMTRYLDERKEYLRMALKEHIDL